MKNIKEIEKIGLFEEIEDKITLIEWPEKIEKKIVNRLELTFYYGDEEKSRKLDFKGFGKWKSFNIDAI